LTLYRHHGYHLTMATRPPKPDIKLVKLTTYLEAMLHKQVRLAAIEDDVPVTRLVEQLLKDYLATRKKRGQRA
jgi:hypothetical protein